MLRALVASVSLPVSSVAVGLVLFVAPADAQWTRVTALPVTDVFTVRALGDTIAAGTDTTVFISTNGGVTWHASAKPDTGIGFIAALWIRNGRLYAGTGARGVFVSDDLGDHWQAFNQGLVGGIFNSQLNISDLEVRADRLFASTYGAGVYVRNLAAADTWHHFGEVFEPNQASNVSDLATDGTRLLACAGANGYTFHRDPNDAEWTLDFLNNVGIAPGLSAHTSFWTGTRWLVGTNIGVFHSAHGSQPWTQSVSGPTNLQWTAFAQRGSVVFAEFDFLPGFIFAESDDDGTTWIPIDPLHAGFAYQLAVHGADLYAARSDGLWVRATTVAAVPATHGPVPLHFALAGANPVRGAARFRFTLPTSGRASIEVYDVAGRRALDRIDRSWAAGVAEVAIDTRGLMPGVYTARIDSGGARETVRWVLAR